MLARTAALVDELTAAMDVYDIAGACERVRDHAEALTNWYVRRSRDRFWAGDPDAIDTLHTVLEVTCRVAAPLLPLTTEKIWQGLTGGRSVHLADWPSAGELLPHDDELVAAMDRVRQVASAALSLRKASGLRVRLPLATLTVAAADAGVAGPVHRHPARRGQRQGRGADHRRGRARPVRDRGERPGLRPAAGRGHPEGDPRGQGGGVGGRAPTAPCWPAASSCCPASSPSGWCRRPPRVPTTATTALPGSSGLVVLDTAVTPELAAEGTARDVVRVVQQARRDAGLDVSDRVTLTLDGPDAVLDAVRAHEAFVAGEVLATAVAYAPVPGADPGRPGRRRRRLRRDPGPGRPLTVAAGARIAAVPGRVRSAALEGPRPRRSLGRGRAGGDALARSRVTAARGECARPTRGQLSPWHERRARRPTRARAGGVGRELATGAWRARRAAGRQRAEMSARLGRGPRSPTTGPHRRGPLAASAVVRPARWVRIVARSAPHPRLSTARVRTVARPAERPDGALVGGHG